MHGMWAWRPWCWVNGNICPLVIGWIWIFQAFGILIPRASSAPEHEDQEVDQFNKFFYNIEKNLASAVPKPNLAFDYYLDKPQASSFFLSPTNSTEIENLIMSLSSTKACGPFSISTSLLKTLKSVLSVPLQLLFNCSFSTGMVPDQFKVARVVPIRFSGFKSNTLQNKTDT